MTYDETPLPSISLSDLFPPEMTELLTASGKNVVRRIGLDGVRSVVLDVLTGRNIRNSTEMLTRRRLIAVNLATVHTFLKGSKIVDDFIEQLPYIAANVLSASSPRAKKMDRWLAQWLLGLTDKGVQNILRDNPQLLAEYRDSYIKACDEVIAQQSEENRELRGTLGIDQETRADIDWRFMVYLLNTIGAQTLTIRGSEKSAYGKIFEKLVLGTLMHLLGFKFRKPGEIENPTRIFWLSTNEDKRESDATLLYEAGKGVRFDIGFIGRGNSEISLDKVTRYQNEIQLGPDRWYMATIIVVDRIGASSKIEQLAHQIGGTIVQMSAGYWPQKVAQKLNSLFGFEHPLVSMEHSAIGEYLKTEIQNAPLEAFIDFAIDNEA